MNKHIIPFKFQHLLVSLIPFFSYPVVVILVLIIFIFLLFSFFSSSDSSDLGNFFHKFQSFGLSLALKIIS